MDKPGNPMQADVEQRLARLREDYARALPAKLDALEAGWREARHGGAGPWQELIRLAHNLAGSGASYGFSKLGDVARELELVIAGFLEHADSGAAPPTDNIMQQFFSNLRKAALEPD